MLRQIAEYIEDLLLEGTATGAVSSYSIDMVPDDDRIEVFVAVVVPVDHIMVKRKER